MTFRTLMAAGLAAACLSGQSALAAEIEGVQFADRYRWQETELRLNGVGVLRYRVFIKGYAAAFYLGEQAAPAQAQALALALHSITDRREPFYH